MKKILFTISNLSIGGSQQSLINILKTFDYKNVEVHLGLYKMTGGLINSVPKEVKMFSILDKCNFPKNQLLFNFLDLLGGTKILDKFFGQIKKTKYDVAIAFDGYAGIPDYYAAFSNADKKIIWVHSDYYARKEHQTIFKIKLLMMKKKYKLFDNIVAVSRSAMDGFVNIFPNQSKKVQYIWNLLDLSYANKLINMKPEVLLEKDKINIVSIGALKKVKGFDRLIEVQNKLKANGYNTKVNILGAGERKKSLQRLIKRHNLDKNVALLGRHQNIFNILNQADLYVCTSYYEGFGIVLLESAFCGVPIIAPKVSGVFDVLSEILPAKCSYITENSVDGIYNGVCKALLNKSQNVKFDFKKYNAKIKSEIFKLLEMSDS